MMNLQQQAYMDEKERIGSTLDFERYSNPTTGILNLVLGAKGFEYEVYDLEGRTLIHEQEKGSNARINLNDLANGSYLIRVTSAGNSETHRFVLCR